MDEGTTDHHGMRKCSWAGIPTHGCPRCKEAESCLAIEVPGTKYGLIDKGWINTSLLKGGWWSFLLEHAGSTAAPFAGCPCHALPARGISIARAHGVNILCLTSHTTHDMQPLDFRVFAPMKSHWSHICHDFLHQNPGKDVTKFNFNSPFSKAWLSAVVPANIEAGFRTGGV